ncbi:MAG TPA: hypothetical protein VGI79_08945, partial [Caulobacteraceae bacterium]
MGFSKVTTAMSAKTAAAISAIPCQLEGPQPNPAPWGPTHGLRSERINPQFLADGATQIFHWTRVRLRAVQAAALKDSA